MMDEIFPLVDEQGNVIGKATRKECHGGTFWLHPVVHLHIFNSKGELFLQKRAMTKDTQPGKWDTAVGGHVDYGEDVETALNREAFEELGVTGFTSSVVARYVWQSAVEKELVNAFRTVYNGKFKLDYNELDEGRFWSIDEIKSSLGKGIFTPNFEHDFMLVMKSLNKEQ
ncbi:MAG: NUDIX domain-containing protein [Bacteroidota bacterium]|nr:NUDIX domain-containing protein [Bacteroidota bacterium]